MGETATAPDDMTLARAALVATRGVPGVVDISPGRYARARTFGLAGETVEGIQVTHTLEGLHAEVHVVVRLTPLPALAEAVRRAVALALAERGCPVAAVDVWVDALREDAPDAEEGERR